MKKTLTINLNNSVFHIDDDAYELLQSYLEEVSRHFKSETEKADIMNDIEARIAELFNEKMDKTKNVVTIEDVGDVIDRLGTPSQFADEAPETEDEKNRRSESQQTNATTTAQVAKKLYRDVDNQLLSGVGSGLAAYLDWDPTLVRILFVLLAFLTSGTFILIYLLLWLIVPKAQTTAQKLEMRGEAVNIQTIKNKMTDAKEYIESDKFKNAATATGNKIWEIVRVLLKIFFTTLIAIVGIVGVILIASLIFGLIVFLLQPDAITSVYPDFFNQFGYITPDKIILLIIALLLIIGCPIFALIYWAMGLTSKNKIPRSNTPLWISLALWLAGIFMFVSAGGDAVKKIKDNGFYPYDSEWNDSDNPNYTTETREMPNFHAIETSGAVKIEFSQQNQQTVTVNTLSKYLPNIKTEVENGVLKIYSTDNLIKPAIHIKIGMDSLTNIVARGASDVYFNTPFNVKKLNIRLQGASKAEMNVSSAQKLGFQLDGASKLELYGIADTLSVVGTGATNVEAYQLLAKVVEIEMSGAGKAQVSASEAFNGRAAGASKISCSGNPKHVHKDFNIGSIIEFEK